MDWATAALAVSGIFITGSDTSVGKTTVACGLIHRLGQQGLRVAAMKPIATGAVQTPTGLRSDDAMRLWQAVEGNTEKTAQRTLSVNEYALLNPYVFAPPIAPYLAAQKEQRGIELAPIVSAYRALCARSDLVLVEGIGGWRVALADNLELVNLVQYFSWPVVLVIGLRLGCINHARLTAEALTRDGINCCGWVASNVDQQSGESPDLLAHLSEVLQPPCLGIVPYQTNPTASSVAPYLKAAARSVMDAIAQKK